MGALLIVFAGELLMSVAYALGVNHKGRFIINR